jgi:hypothetical protein
VLYIREHLCNAIFLAESLPLSRIALPQSGNFRVPGALEPGTATTANRKWDPEDCVPIASSREKLDSCPLVFRGKKSDPF